MNRIQNPARVANPLELASESRLARWRRKLKRDGVRGIVARRWNWYRYRFCVRFRPLTLQYIALKGNHIRLHGGKFFVGGPLITPEVRLWMYCGRYEDAEIELLKNHLDPSLPTVELGGSIGVVACLTNRKLERPTEHVVVEANSLLIPTLERNRALNNAQFEILQKAVGYGVDSINFYVNEGAFNCGSTVSPTSHVISAPTTSLGPIIQERGFQAINLIVDIEGAETDLVANELDVLKRRVRHLLLETHQRYLPEGSTDAMLDALLDAGFEIVSGDRLNDHVLALVNRNLESPGDAPDQDARSPQTAG